MRWMLCRAGWLMRDVGSRKWAAGAVRGTGVEARFFFFQAEDGIRDDLVWSSDVCSSDLYRPMTGEDEVIVWRERERPGGKVFTSYLKRGHILPRPKKDIDYFGFPVPLPIAPAPISVKEIGRASCRERV